MCVVIHLLYDRVVFPVWVIFCNVYYFPCEMIGGEVFFSIVFGVSSEDSLLVW